ncbi:hypothetical protein [Rhodoferax sp.]|uniref:hypothetical protein n=1 Tax=Rhodoferax sp. TaxID=50421 RepID=UPI002ACDF24C|nr:hypothetical protein [Rhodoferax sp.]MDZ7919416.1 hypothetical protein [Rhodoferax sp.]
MTTKGATKDSFWKTVFKTPSAARTATVVMLIVWGIAAIWGWFFVEPTVLRDSQAARDYVEWASRIFPWLDNIRRLVPQAEKGLYLHSVYTVALAPFSVVWALSLCRFQAKRTHAGSLTLRDSFVGVCFCLVLSIFYIFVMYDGVLQPSFGKLHRTGYSFVLNGLTVPTVAPFFIISFWLICTFGLYSVGSLLGHFVRKESLHG